MDTWNGRSAGDPPSLEQIVYAASDDAGRPNIAVVAAGRLLDSPRRVFRQLGF